MHLRHLGLVLIVIVDLQAPEATFPGILELLKNKTYSRLDEPLQKRESQARVIMTAERHIPGLGNLAHAIKVIPSQTCIQPKIESTSGSAAKIVSIIWRTLSYKGLVFVCKHSLQVYAKAFLKIMELLALLLIWLT